MSMLAERKRKTKWVLNSTKKPLWATDSESVKFGKKLMEKMGWSAGKGLGANEQGIQEPLKVSYKNDTKGMGFKGNDDDWIEHQNEFNMLLKQLSKINDSITVDNSSAEKHEVKSLEEKSKQSKARIHYHKFTKGKDLSKYSENDLACILGSSKKKKEKNKTQEVVQTNTKITSNYETSFGVTTINSGSIEDYFKRKPVHNKAKISDCTITDETAENFSQSNSEEKLYLSTTNEENINFKNKEKKKLKGNSKSKNEDEESKISQLDDLKSSKKLSKRKNTERVEVTSEEEPKSKKKKKNCDDALNETLQDQDNLNNVTKDLEFKKSYDFNSIKKRKEDKNLAEGKVLGDNEKSEYSKKKKKKKKKKEKEKCLENNNQDVHPTKVINKTDEVNMKAYVDIRSKMRKSFYNEKEADKYAPGDRKNKRVLSLIRWVNISEFKGSNLENVEGYGRRKMYEKQFR